MDTEDRPYDGDPVADGRLAQSSAAQARDYYAFVDATVWTAKAQGIIISRDLDRVHTAGSRGAHVHRRAAHLRCLAGFP